jgi:hypothetical protein
MPWRAFILGLEIELSICGHRNMAYKSWSRSGLSVEEELTNGKNQTHHTNPAFDNIMFP